MKVSTVYSLSLCARHGTAQLQGNVQTRFSKMHLKCVQDMFRTNSNVTLELSCTVYTGKPGFFTQFCKLM